MTFTVEQIQSHYKDEASKHGSDASSTIQDWRTRELELKALFSYMRDGDDVLEVGCGNGYCAEELVKKFQVNVDATDFSLDLITIAQKRSLGKVKGRVNFVHQDVLELNAEEKYDLIFTERCLQNLVSWEDQQKALKNIVNAMKPGSKLVLLESFWTGLNQLNEARKELDLSEVSPPWHNLFFDEPKTIEYLASLSCNYQEQNCFLSGYYFGSRVIYPSLLRDGKQPHSSSVLNNYFWQWPSNGDFCPMKIMVFCKN
jgi:ubiquinone/menaquinone biosynthesis C-methylase UbiE